MSDGQVKYDLRKLEKESRYANSRSFAKTLGFMGIALILLARFVGNAINERIIDWIRI